MRNTTLAILLAGLSWLLPSPLQAQVDPTLTAMILEYTEKAKSQYKAQLQTMAVETEGHVWLRQEVEETKNYQQQFDRYISTFRGILSYAAQVYGTKAELVVLGGMRHGFRNSLPQHYHRAIDLAVSFCVGKGRLLSDA